VDFNWTVWPANTHPRFKRFSSLGTPSLVEMR